MFKATQKPKVTMDLEQGISPVAAIRREQR
jgi:hypothetical protein